MSCEENNCSIENRWDKISYGEQPFTSMGEMPLGSSWPMNFFRKTADGRFETLDGKPVSFRIKTPDFFDRFWEKQLPQVMEASNHISEEQKIISTYWGSGVPNRQIIPIIQTLISTYGLQVIEASRLYDILMRANNDATVICWHFKYYYQVPRPVQYCPDFKPYLKTPQHPSYPAGHSVMPACMIRMLAYFFPKESEKLYQILNECSMSRLYAGVHYLMDIEEGNKLGIDIANKILAILSQEADQSGATINLIWDKFKDAPIYPTNHQQVLN